MFDNYPHLRRNVLIAGIITAVTLLAALLLYINNSMLFVPHGYIVVSSVPETITLTYDGKVSTITANTGNKIPVATGNHLLTFTSDGFDGYSQTVNISKDQSYDIVFALTARSDAAKKEAGLDKYKTVYERIVGFKLGTESTQYAERYPILKALPINTLQYTIESCAPYATSSGVISRIGICITVTDVQDKSQVDAAIAELTSASYNPDEFIITINGHHYPTTQERANNFCTLTDSGVCTDVAN